MFEHVQEFGLNLIVTGISAAFAKSIIAPLERTKLILQNQEQSLQVLKQQRQTYTGILDVLLRVPKEQGILSFWRGNGTNVVRYIPTQSLNFAFNDLYKTFVVGLMNAEDWRLAIFVNFLSGALAGISTTIIVFPLDFCTTKITVDIGTDSRFDKETRVRREFKGLKDCLKSVYKMHGLSGYYQGIQPGIIGLAIYRSLFFGLFELNKMNWLGSERNTTYEQYIPIHVSFLLAQSAALIAGTTAYPFDTIMRTLMLDAGRKKKYRTDLSPLETFKDIYSKRGFRGFYKGLTANCLRSIGGSIVLVLYDKILYYTEWKKFIKGKPG